MRLVQLKTTMQTMCSLAVPLHFGGLLLTRVSGEDETQSPAMPRFHSEEQDALVVKGLFFFVVFFFLLLFACSRI